MSDNESPESFDKDYVKSLRAEAAKYRTELKEVKSELESFRSLEKQISTVRIENELIRRGVNANPEWIQIKNGQSPQEAVETFLEKFPQFAGGEQVSVEHKPVPKAIPPSQEKAGHPGYGPNGMLGDRDLSEIKKDPIARGNLRDLYRDLLRTSSNQTS